MICKEGELGSLKGSNDISSGIDSVFQFFYFSFDVAFNFPKLHYKVDELMFSSGNLKLHLAQLLKSLTRNLNVFW